MYIHLLGMHSWAQNSSKQWYRQEDVLWNIQFFEVFPLVCFFIEKTAKSHSRNWAEQSPLFSSFCVLIDWQKFSKVNLCDCCSFLWKQLKLFSCNPEITWINCSFHRHCFLGKKIYLQIYLYETSILKCDETTNFKNHLIICKSCFPFSFCPFFLFLPFFFWGSFNLF